MSKVFQSAFLIVAAMVASGFLVVAAISAASSVATLEQVTDVECGIELARDRLPQDHILDRVLLTALFEDQRSISLKPEHDAIALWKPSDRGVTIEEAPLSLAAINDPVVALTYSEGRTALERILNTLPSDDALVLEGLLRKSIDRFGDGVSFEGDILPLLENAGSLQIVEVDDGRELLLEGSTQKSTELNAIVDRLHKSFTSTLPSVRVTTRRLDRRFASTDLRHDTSLIQHTEESESSGMCDPPSTKKRVTDSLRQHWTRGFLSVPVTLS